MDEPTDTCAAASRRYPSRASITRREINAAADDLLKRTDWERRREK